MSEPVQHETITIDPIAMNVVNRVAAGTRQAGSLQCRGGLLIEGQLTGELEVLGGPLIVMQGAELSGSIRCDGDSYVFGSILPRDEGQLSELRVAGVVYLAETAVAQAEISAGAFKMSQGARVDARMKSFDPEGAATTGNCAAVAGA